MSAAGDWFPLVEGAELSAADRVKAARSAKS